MWRSVAGGDEKGTEIEHSYKEPGPDWDRRLVQPVREMLGDLLMAGDLSSEEGVRANTLIHDAHNAMLPLASVASNMSRGREDVIRGHAALLENAEEALLNSPETAKSVAAAFRDEAVAKIVDDHITQSTDPTNPFGISAQKGQQLAEMQDSATIASAMDQFAAVCEDAVGKFSRPRLRQSGHESRALQLQPEAHEGNQSRSDIPR